MDSEEELSEGSARKGPESEREHVSPAVPSGPEGKESPGEGEEDEERSGCCYGWLGLRYVADRIGSLFFEDPIETITACKCDSFYHGSNIDSEVQRG
ncbi:MAG: hypothetical protein P4M11_15580 [Candidatus Pacebacteria bacterium]|nr:hypothetical protein [Candidatus Paceibacterota bacterium]